MREFVKNSGNLMRRTSVIVGVCLLSTTLQIGCKSGEAWTPKMPKFGTPALAFGTKSKADEKIEPPAMNFSPDQTDRTRLAKEARRPFGVPDSSETLGRNTPSRSPYAVDEEDTSTSALAEAARVRQENTKSEIDRLRDSGLKSNSTGLGSTNSFAGYGQSGRNMDNSITNSPLMPSGNNGSGLADIRSIPGGPIGNSYPSPKLNNSLEADRSAPAQNSFPSLPAAPNSSLAGNALPPAFNNSAAPGINGLSTLPADLGSSSSSMITNQNMLPPPPPPGFGQSASSGLASGGLNAGLPSASTIPSTPGGGYNAQVTATTPAPSMQTVAPLQPAAPARPNPGASFRPGSTASASGLPAFPTSGNANRSPAAAPQGYPQTPAPAYPTTPHGSFRPATGNVQPVNYQSGLPAFPGNASNGQFPAANRNAANPQAMPAGSPPGMVCVGDQCFVPQ